MYTVYKPTSNGKKTRQSSYRCMTILLGIRLFKETNSYTCNTCIFKS